MIQEILSNSVIVRFNDDFVRIKNFSPDQKSMSWQYSNDVYQYAFENGVYTDEEIQQVLEILGYWSEEDQLMIDKIYDDIESMKIDYFDNFFPQSRREQIKRAILANEQKLEDLMKRKSYLSDFTCESARNEAYYHFLFADYDHGYHLSRLYLSSIAKEEEIRSLYFNNTWRMIWSSSKDPMSIFGCTMNHLNENQLNLLYWSKMYDSMYEAEDTPCSEIMKDHYAVDGFLLKKSKKRRLEEKTKHIVKDNNHGEVFQVVKNRKEQAEINSLNAPDVKKVITSKAKELKEKGDMNEIEFSHVKFDIGMQINAMNGKK